MQLFGQPLACLKKVCLSCIVTAVGFGLLSGKFGTSALRSKLIRVRLPDCNERCQGIEEQGQDSVSVHTANASHYFEASTPASQPGSECGQCTKCEKWSTTGFHEGQYLQVQTASLTWQQCAQKCASFAGCEFWTLQLTGRRACLLMKHQGEYVDTIGHFEGPPAVCNGTTKAQGTSNTAASNNKQTANNNNSDLGCWTRCNGQTPNIISLREHGQESYWTRVKSISTTNESELEEVKKLDRGAGLNDRTHIFHKMGNIAAAFCARLAIGRPCDFLGRHPSPPSCNQGWSHYLHFEKSWHIMLQDTSKNQLNAECAADPHRTCISGGCNVPQIALILDLLLREKAFTWSITEHSYSCMSNIENSLKGDPRVRGSTASLRVRVRAASDKLSISSPFCEAVLPWRSGNIQELGVAALRLMNLTSKRYAALHLRRGDAVKQCDTTLPSVRRYAVEKIVPEMLKIDSTSLVFLTDELDSTYLQGVKVIFADLGVKASHGDGVLKHLDPNADNYVIFAAGQRVAKTAALRFQMRRYSHCPYGPPNQTNL